MREILRKYVLESSAPTILLGGGRSERCGSEEDYTVSENVAYLWESRRWDESDMRRIVEVRSCGKARPLSSQRS